LEANPVQLFSQYLSHSFITFINSNILYPI